MLDPELQKIIDGEPDYERRRQLLAEDYAAYLKTHPRQWVALAEGDVWVLADSLEALVQKLDQSGLPRVSAVISYLDPDSVKLKL